ncbi:MAG: 50S ribosomal protein L17 [Candidatus Moraniibacteriota bacterium]
MRKRIKGRKIQREKDQREALLRTLLVSLIKKKKITTTLAKAKELRPFAERKITIAKRGLNGSEIEKVAKIRLLKKDLPNQETIKELFEIAKHFQKREGGYTRILKLMPRKSDASEMALIEWVDSELLVNENKSDKKADKKQDSKKDNSGSKENSSETAKNLGKEKTEEKGEASTK